MSMTPNQSKDANKPSPEDAGTDRTPGKIQSLAQYHESIQFARIKSRATTLYKPTPLRQVEVACDITDREIIDADPVLLEVERELMEGLADEKGLPPTDNVSTSSGPAPSACQLSDISSISSTKRSFGEIGESCDSLKKPRLDRWSYKGITD
jgi:hypothetical protein